MHKRQTRKAAPRKRPDDLTIAVALERARLKRLVAAKRQVTRLASELRRVMDSSDRALRELAVVIALRQVDATGADLARRSDEAATGRPVA